jgi:hypothetical protein
MLVYRSNDLDLEGFRDFPWTASLGDPRGRYYDFKENPGLIRTKLENFVEWGRYDGIKIFYEGLEWLNSAESELESDDCGFMGPRENDDLQFEKKLKCSGRLMVFFRRLEFNCIETHTRWLMECFKFHLERVDSEFEWGAIGLSRCDIRFTPVDKMGSNLVLYYWAWGDDQEETMDNLTRTFKGLFGAARRVSNEIAEPFKNQSL